MLRSIKKGHVLDSSDYIFSLRALNLWLEDLEKVNQSSNDPEIDDMICQVKGSFENIFKRFSEQYKDETGVEPPENLCEIMIYTQKPKGVRSVEDNLKREVFLSSEVISSIVDLVVKDEYTKLQSAFQNLDESGRVYLNLEEAEALIELVIIEQKKALLKYPNYDKNLDSYNLEHENKVLRVQQDLYEKVVDSITESFKEFDKECLI